MIEKGMLLYFIPPYFASGEKNIELKKRLMLVVDINTEDNTLALINISKINGKPGCLTYSSNILIRNYNPPLPMASFEKINDNYIVENFDGIEKYLYKNGYKLDSEELKNIITKHNNYKNKNKLELISFTKEEFMKINN